MTALHPAHVALIDETGGVAQADLAALAAALSDQVASDFGPVWAARAVVAPCAADAKPARSWAIRIRRSLDQPGALGYHTDSQNQPVAYVELTDSYSVTCSHELLEMLADPWGNRMHWAEPPAGLSAAQLGELGVAATDSVGYLVEVGDPCEETSYPVSGVRVSDFILPAWYRTSPAVRVAYSHAGGCTAPRQVADGGYVSFSRQDGEWFQIFSQGGALQVSDLGRYNSAEGRPLREWADERSRARRAATAVPAHKPGGEQE